MHPSVHVVWYLRLSHPMVDTEVNLRHPTTVAWIHAAADTSFPKAVILTKVGVLRLLGSTSFVDVYVVIE